MFVARAAAVADAMNHFVYWTCMRAGVTLCAGHDDVDLAAHAWWWAVRFHGCVLDAR